MTTDARYSAVELTRQAKTARDEAVRAANAAKASVSAIAISASSASQSVAEVRSRQAAIEALIDQNVPAHEWTGTSLRLRNPNGAWGDLVNLIGPRGPAGPRGERGIPGQGGGDMRASVYDPDGDGKVDVAASADSVAWAGIAGRPETFPATAHGHSIAQVTGLQDALDAAELAANRGEPGGYAPLDESGKVPSSFLPVDGAYQGTWDAATNTPTITGGVGTVGDFFIVSVGGTTSIDGVSTWAAGDQIRFNGSAWQRIPSFNAVSSVAGKTGAVTLWKGDVGLGNANNTSDVNKPVSTAQKAAIDLVADFPTMADVQAATLGFSRKTIRTAGFYAPGDGGGALYRILEAPEANCPVQWVAADGVRIIYAEEILRVEAFGAYGTSTGTGSGSSDAAPDDAPAFQRAIDFGVWRGLQRRPGVGQPFAIEMSARIYKVAQRIDARAATEGFAIFGRGQQATIIAPTPFGAGDYVFWMPEDVQVYMADFKVARGSPHAQHPIAFYFPTAGRLKIERVGSGGYGGMVLWISRVFNADIVDCDWFFSGWYWLRKSIASNVTVTTTAGSDVINASAAIFSAGDVGKMIYIGQHPNEGSFSYSNSCMVGVVVQYISTTSVRLSAPAHRSRSDCTVAWGHVGGTISAGGTTLDLDGAVLTSDDTGRFVFIDGAGASGGVHAARMTYVNASRATLDVPAVTAVAGARVFTSPTVYVGGYGVSGSASMNDIRFSRCLFEQYRGVGIILDGGLHAFLTDCKFHGVPPYDGPTFSRSAEPIMVSGTRGAMFETLHLEFGCSPAGGGLITINGDNPQVSIGHVTKRGNCYGDTAFIDWNPADTETSSLYPGKWVGNADWSWLLGGPVKRRSDAAMRRVFGGEFKGYANEHIAQMRHVFGSVAGPLVDEFIAAEEAVEIPVPGGHAIVLISADDTANIRGMYLVRTGSTPSCTQMAGVGSLMAEGTGTLTSGSSGGGVDGRVNLYASTGRIYLKNRLGAGRRFTLTLIG